MKKLAYLAIAASLLVAGCETTSAYPYKASTENVLAFQSALSGTPVRVGNFEAAPGIKTSPNCRLMGPVEVVPGKTMQQFIKEALQEELFMAQAYKTDAPVAINGRIDRIDLNTIGTGSWDIAMTVFSDRDPGYQVETKFPFSSSYSAVNACRNAAAAFSPAVQGLLGKVVAHPGFKKLASGR